MTDQLLLSYACEMLSRTNPYQKGVESFHYHCSQKDEISLLSLIDNHPDIRGHRMSSDKRLGKQKNIRTCFRAISNAMVTYMKSYPAASSCKSRMKEKFVLWLEAIRKEYQITDTDCSIPEALYTVYALNKFGALVDRADDVWKFKKLKPGSRDESKKFKLSSPSRVKYVDVETAK